MCILGLSCAILRRCPRDHTMNAFMGRLTCESLVLIVSISGGAPTTNQASLPFLQPSTTVFLSCPSSCSLPQEEEEATEAAADVVRSSDCCRNPLTAVSLKLWTDEFLKSYLVSLLLLLKNVLL